jgi:hypothetical protein
LFRAEEVHHEFAPRFHAQEARHVTLSVLAKEPALLGFVVGAAVEFVYAFGGKISDERRNLIMAEIWFALFGKAGVKQFFSFWAANGTKPPFTEGMAAGQRIVAYQFGGDYSHDPNAAEAIAMGRSLEAAAADSVRVKNPGDERGQLVEGMMWLHFNAPFAQARRCEGLTPDLKAVPK